MPDEDSLRVMYETRRQARGGQPPARSARWRRRFVLIGVALVAVVAAGVGIHARWASTHVKAMRGAVAAALVSLSPPTDVRVHDLLVKPGERVVRGQPLVRFGDSEARAAVDAAEAEMAIAESKHAQAQAIAQRIEMRVGAEIESAQAGITIASARAASAKASLECRRTRLPEEIRLAEAERDQARARLERLKKGTRPEDIETAKVRLSTAKALEDFCALELEQIRGLAGEGLQALNAVQIKEARLVAQQGTVREAALALARLEAGSTAEEIEAAQQALASREAALALASIGNKEVEALTSDLAMREAERRQAEADLRQVEATRLEVTIAKEQVKAAAAERRRAEAEVARGRAVLEAMTILSPVNGTVHRTLHRQGEVCKKGEPTILVADDSAGRWVEAYVREEDAEYVKAGQRADVALATGADLRATVDAVALSTSSLARGSSDTGPNVPAGNPSVMVWIRLRFEEENADPLPGTSARVVIRIR